MILIKAGYFTTAVVKDLYQIITSSNCYNKKDQSYKRELLIILNIRKKLILFKTFSKKKRLFLKTFGYLNCNFRSQLYHLEMTCIFHLCLQPASISTSRMRFSNKLTIIMKVVNIIATAST